MTLNEGLDYLKNRVSKLALIHKIGSRDIANLEVKDIVMGIETHFIPTLEKALAEHERLQRGFDDVVGNVIELTTQLDKALIELEELKQKEEISDKTIIYLQGLLDEANASDTSKEESSMFYYNEMRRYKRDLEELKRDVGRYFSIMENAMAYNGSILDEQGQLEFDELYNKLGKVGQ